jgi:hypothetical protein
MPNHITNVIQMTGTDGCLAAVFTMHVIPNDKGEPFFDFDTVIPMPQSVKESIRRWEPGSTNNVNDCDVEACARALTELRSRFITERPFWLPAEVTTWGELIKWYEDTKPDVLKYARNALQAAAETGHPGWYGWSIANWGTKWGAYDYKMRDHVTFEFQTAWSPPEPILRALSAKHPLVVFKVTSVDEGGWEYEGSFCNGEGEIKEVPHSAERRKFVYGRDPESDEDEEGTVAP